MVFIIGVVIGLVILILNEPSSIQSISQLATNTKMKVEDISDISVI